MVASSKGSQAVGVNGLKVKPDTTFVNSSSYEYAAIVLIGGPGMTEYYDNEVLQMLVKDFLANHNIVAAISTAPVVQKLEASQQAQQQQ